MKIKLLFEFELDPGTILLFRRASVPIASARPVMARQLTVDDFPANRLAINCARCNARVPKLQGYKQYYSSGFLCQPCQIDADQPVRV